MPGSKTPRPGRGRSGFDRTLPWPVATLPWSEGTERVFTEDVTSEQFLGGRSSGATSGGRGTLSENKVVFVSGRRY